MSIPCAIYFDLATGQAKQSIVCSFAHELRPPDLETGILVLPEKVALPGYVVSNLYYELPPPPAPQLVFNYTTKQWEDPRTLSDFKLEKQEHLKKQRDEAEFGPFTYNGMTFDGDLDAQRRLSVLVSAAKSAIAAGYSFTKDFTLADNTVVQLSAEDFIGIEMAKLWQVDVAFQEYREKKARIDSATTLEELEAI